MGIPGAAGLQGPPSLHCLLPEVAGGRETGNPPHDLRELLGRPSLAGRQDMGPSGKGSLLLIWVGFLLAQLVASWPPPHQLHCSFHQPVQSRGARSFQGLKQGMGAESRRAHTRFEEATSSSPAPRYLPHTKKEFDGDPSPDTAAPVEPQPGLR